MIDTKETANLPPVFCFVFFALVVITKGLEDLKEMTKGRLIALFEFAGRFVFFR